MTKGTAYIFAAPWLLVLAGVLVWRMRVRATVPLAMVAAVVLLLNAGHWLRNHATYGSILGTKVEHGIRYDYSYANAGHGPGAIFSGVLRNGSLHLAGESLSVGEHVGNAVRAMHAWFGLNPEDPLTTWPGEPYRLYDNGWNSSDYAGNPSHFLLILGCAIGAAVRFRRVRWSLAAMIGGLSLIGFLAFCAYLRWQPWHGRLYLPLFIVAGTAVGVAIQRLRFGFHWVLAGVLLLGAGWRILDNRQHPLRGEGSIFRLPRDEQYLANARGMAPAYRKLGESLQRAQIDTIGLISNTDDPEYLLWALWKLRGVQHVEVTNLSARLPRESGDPGAIFVLKLDQRQWGFLVKE